MGKIDKNYEKIKWMQITRSQRAPEVKTLKKANENHFAQNT